MASTTGWNSSTELGAAGTDQSSNNNCGFNAFPEGSRYYNGSFDYEGYDAFFWSSTESNTDYARYPVLISNYSDLYRTNGFGSKQNSCSVRFVRD